MNNSKLKEIRNSILEYVNEEPIPNNEPQDSSRNLNPTNQRKSEMDEWNPEMGVRNGKEGR